MKGGHLEGQEAVDLLVTPRDVRRFGAPRIASRNLHGTGCTLSSAIAANVVLGMALAGGCGGGQGVRARGDRAGRARHAGRWTRPADPGEAALKL